MSSYIWRVKWIGINLETEVNYNEIILCWFNSRYRYLDANNDNMYR